MAHRKFDSVSQVATGTGPGALLLGLASDERFRTLQAAGMADGDTTEVRIQHESVRAEWEDVLIARSGNSITRTFDARVDHVLGVRRHAVADQFAQDLCAARLGMLQLFKNENAGALAQNGTVALLGERENAFR